MLKIDPVALTDVGRKREHNEDYLGDLLIRGSVKIEPEKLTEKGYLFAVADGMGGYAAGEVASELAITTLFDHYYNKYNSGNLADDLMQSIVETNAEVHRQGQSSGRGQMGTTLTIAVIKGNRLLVGNVGDSRTYLIRNGIPLRVTRDHSLVQDQIDMGAITPEQAQKSMIRNIITRAIGHREEVEPDLFEQEMQTGDIILLCSDGLHGLVQEMEIGSIVGSAGNLKQAAKQLIDLANERGGSDNISVLIVGITEVGETIPAIINGRKFNGLTATMPIPAREPTTNRLPLVGSADAGNSSIESEESPPIETPIPPASTVPVPGGYSGDEPTRPMVKTVKSGRGGFMGMIAALVIVALVAAVVLIVVNGQGSPDKSATVVSSATITTVSAAPVATQGTLPTATATTLASAGAVATPGVYTIDRSQIKKVQIKLSAKTLTSDYKGPNFKIMMNQEKDGISLPFLIFDAGTAFKEPTSVDDQNYFTYEANLPDQGQMSTGTYTIQPVLNGQVLATKYTVKVEDNRIIADTANNVMVSGNILQLFYSLGSSGNRQGETQPEKPAPTPQPVTTPTATP